MILAIHSVRFECCSAGKNDFKCVTTKLRGAEISSESTQMRYRLDRWTGTYVCLLLKTESRNCSFVAAKIGSPGCFDSFLKWRRTADPVWLTGSGVVTGSDVCFDMYREGIGKSASVSNRCQTGHRQ